MQSVTRRDFLETSLLAAGAVLLGPRAGQSAIAPGVEAVASPLLTGEEQQAQPDIWALEVRFKPVRMIQLSSRDAATGASNTRLMWYLAYRAVVRPSSHVAELPADSPERPMFVPELTLVTTDEGNMESYPDRILPAAQEAINKRERHNYKNSVEIVGPLPAVTPDNARRLRSLDGVATWVDVNPDTDFFTVFLTGFSNGYKVSEGPDGEPVVLRRTLMQKFWRPSDRFDQHEDEIRLQDEPRWVYR